MADTPEDPDTEQPRHITLPDFTPVARKCERHDGWTPTRQKLFIEALADYGSVRAAANSVGLAPEGAYRLRRQPGAEEFAAAREAALACGIKRLEDALMDRALNGVEVPVYSYGKLLGTRTKYNDRLGMFMLRSRAPDRFARGGAPKALNVADKSTLRRLKKEWHAEWERERAILAAADDKDVFEKIDRQIETIRQNRWNNMSPRARAAYEEADRIREEDGTDWMLDEIEAEEDAGEIRIPLPPGREEELKEEEEARAGPRVRSLKDDGW